MRVVIDDFGVGYVGLLLFVDFILDKIKLDRKIMIGIYESGYW